MSRLEYKLPSAEKCAGAALLCYQVLSGKGGLQESAVIQQLHIHGLPLLLITVLLLPMGRRKARRKMPRKRHICSTWGLRVFVKGCVGFLEDVSKLSKKLS